MHILKKFTILSSFILLSLTALGQYTPEWKSIDKRPTPTWFEDAKFGIFIHWGVYSVPAWATKSNADGFGSGYAEWYWQRLFAPKLKIHQEFVDFHHKNYGNKSYQDLASDFRAELYEPDVWAKIFKNSGAKYVVLTSKHHEGFALWPSKYAWNWNAMDIGAHRDLLGDLTTAVKSNGLKMGYYYSLYEWFNPQYKNDIDAYVTEYMQPQMKELVQTYEPDILWTDGEWDKDAKTWQSEDFLAWLFSDSKVKNNVVVNDRWGKDTKGKHGSFYTSEYGHTGSDNNGKGQDFEKPWEECRGMGESFGYNRYENLENYQSGEELVHQLIDVVARGGNLLLNIGPTADGRIPVIMQERLSEIGAWLEVNGEAIYGTRKYNEAPDYTKESTVFYTQKENQVFIIQTDWQNTIELETKKRPKSVRLLGYDGDISFSHKRNTLTINAPLLSPKTIPCDYAWTYAVEW